MGHSLPYLLPTIEEKLVGIDTICDGASYERYPMKDDWWLIWIFEEKLVQNVEDDCEDDKRSETCSNNYTRRFVCKQILQRLSDNSKETHSLKRPKEDAEVLESARDCLQLIQRLGSCRLYWEESELILPTPRHWRVTASEATVSIYVQISISSKAMPQISPRNLPFHLILQIH